MSEIITVDLADTSYKIIYEEDNEWNYKIYRHDEDVTDQMSNNLVFAMLQTIIDLKN